MIRHLQPGAAPRVGDELAEKRVSDRMGGACSAGCRLRVAWVTPLTRIHPDGRTRSRPRTWRERGIVLVARSRFPACAGRSRRATRDQASLLLPDEPGRARG